jgi:aminoglycoside 3-N-acetyltransferase
MNKLITRETIVNDLQNLGIQNGDVLFITADLFNVGYFNKSKSQTLNDWILIFSDVLGEEGCFIAGSYTKTFFRFKKDTNIVFNPDAKTDLGAFANAMLKYPSAIRSKHPTHSCIGIGKNVERFLNNHDVNSSSYKVLDNILKENGKFLMLGTLDKKNAPQAMHLAQENLGYSKYNPYKWFFQTYYFDKNNQKKLYTKIDYGGCSAGGYKLFGPLIVENAIEIQYVGNAKSALMDAKLSYDVISNILIKNKQFILCDDTNCTQCYGNFFYNGWKIIPFFIKKGINLIIGKRTLKLG